MRCLRDIYKVPYVLTSCLYKFLAHLHNLTANCRSLPKNEKVAYKIDSENENTYWSDAIERELEEIMMLKTL